MLQIINTMKKTILCFLLSGLFFIALFPQSSEHQHSLPNFGMGNLPYLMDVETRMVSPENPTGEKGMGGMAIPDPDDPNLPFSKSAQHLGQGWKVSPFFKVKPGATVTIMDLTGPGMIQHIWMATLTDWSGSGRACIMRFYWDVEKEPSIEVPMTDFFAVGHDNLPGLIPCRLP